MQAPLVHVTLHTGESVPLASLYQDRPLVLVFLRHFGCIFCRDQITQLRQFVEENVVMVAMGKAQETADFREKMGSPQTFISDPLKTLYEQFGLRRGNLTQMFNPNTISRGFEAMRRGGTSSIPTMDPWMLAGVFRIATDGNVTFSHFSRDVADNLAGQEIIALLEQA